MREGKPLRQLSCRFIGGMPVERHHGRWDARRTQQLCTPTGGDVHDLYEVRAPADGFFEAVNGHVAIFERRRDDGRSYASATADQAKRDAKAACTPLGAQSIEASSEKKYAVSVSQQLLHASSTTFPQPAYCEPVPSRTREYNEVPRRNGCGHETRSGHLFVPRRAERPLGCLGCDTVPAVSHGWNQRRQLRRIRARRRARRVLHGDGGAARSHDCTPRRCRRAPSTGRAPIGIPPPPGISGMPRPAGRTISCA